MYIKNIKYLLVLFVFLSFLTTEASYTNGTIDPVYKSALLCTNDICTTTSQINFKPTLGNPVSITDSALTGNIWSETFGWVNLNPNYGGVTNTPAGVLGGYAWGDGAGWINFAPTQGGVTINNSGQFSGFAWSENYGWIKFDCNINNACVTTDWRPLSFRPSNNLTSGSISGGSIPITAVDTPINNPTITTSSPVSIKIIKKPIIKIHTSDESIPAPDNNDFINQQPEKPPVVTDSDIKTSKKLTSNFNAAEQKEVKNTSSLFGGINNLITQSIGFVEGNIFSNYFMGISFSYKFFNYHGYINPLLIVLSVIIIVFLIIFRYKKKNKKQPLEV